MTSSPSPLSIGKIKNKKIQGDQSNRVMNIKSSIQREMKQTQSRNSQWGIANWQLTWDILQERSSSKRPETFL